MILTNFQLNIMFVSFKETSKLKGKGRQFKEYSSNTIINIQQIDITKLDPKIIKDLTLTIITYSLYKVYQMLIWEEQKR